MFNCSSFIYTPYANVYILTLVSCLLILPENTYSSVSGFGWLKSPMCPRKKDMKETEDSRHICPCCPYMHDPGVSPCTWAYFIVLHYCPAECFYMPYMCVWYVRGHLGRLPRYSSLSACYRESIGWRARVSPARPRLRVVLIRFWSRTTYQRPELRNKVKLPFV